MREVEVAVVGAGVMGTATAYWLGVQGRRAALFERFRLGHKRGSSHGPTRIFRLSYPDKRNVAMAVEALPLWREAERELEEDLLVTTGGLDIGQGIDANAAALEAQGAAFEMLDGAEVGKRWPFVQLPSDGTRALFQPDSGVVLADQAVAAFARGAADRGVELHEETIVTRLEVDEDDVVLHVHGGDPVPAQVAVVTAGSWAKELLATADISLPVRPTRETVAYFKAGHAVPPTLVEWGAPTIYALPSSGHEIKAAEHGAGHDADPNEEGVPDYNSVERIAEWVAERFPETVPAPTHVETCLYTNTSDEGFILERHGPIVVGSPCSGHGFKFAVLIGRRLAELAST